ncbi:hypothetical protein CEP52_003293 [Fusarium oligoseptatum]|uniref:Zn(2)-C6 fungal-type domain-containing protein n=1 Tax=Fusarium oligoseptatum TaxID=2604345 RepID=A0A428U926_9HYPO|nr:hypothetical protein CEP52_003293 [Fusarium oligoseptatum]
MATDLTSTVKRPTARRKDPACGTCRKKCRKCDRKRPICDRCRTKGLHCEGYPPRFQFCEMMTVPLARRDSQSTRRDSVALSSTPSFPISGESPSGSSSAAVQEAVTTASVTDSASPQASLSPDQGLPDSTILSLPSPASVSHSPFTPVHIGSTSPLIGTPDLSQDIISNRPLIDYFDQILSEYLTIHIQGTDNPFRIHVLPLASQHFVAISLQYRVSALHSLGALLLQEEVSALSVAEEEYVLCMALLLVLHDVCETGVSSHGAHLTGVSFLCKRLACPTDFSTRSKASMFFISALAWLDMLRGFSGAEKLSYSEDVRRCVRDHGSLSLHTLVGCPPVIFHRIGQVLEAGKAFRAGELLIDQFQALLDEAEKFFRGWDPDQAVYPTGHQEWKHLAEAYRHSCLLRVLRFPDPFAMSCEDSRIKASVAAIFDVCAAMPRDTMHYASWCVGEIKHATGFQHPAMTEMLTKVWEERRTNPHGWSNVPWMEFTCSELLRDQHAYLFF